MADLSFIGRRPDGRIDLWSPETVAGGWDQQCDAGSQIAEGAITYIERSGNAAMLPGIVRTLVQRGTWSGVEVGFFSALSMRLTEAAN